MPITPQTIANGDQIDRLVLSPTGERVVYGVGPWFRGKDEHKTQALWLADVGVQNSTRKITTGLFYDRDPAFDPKSGDIFFLSDRHKAGGAAQIYRLSVAAFGGDPVPLTPTKNVKGVSSFKISPDGRWLAYVSPDEPEDKDEESKDSYVIVWQAPKDLGRLRLLDLASQDGSPRTVVSVPRHVTSFTWAPDSKHILYRLSELPSLETNAFPISEHILSFTEQGAGLDTETTCLVTHKRVLSSESVWVRGETERFCFLHGGPSSAPALWTCETSPGSSPLRVAFGETDDASSLVLLGEKVAVEVACGLETRIDVVDVSTQTISTAFETSNEAFSRWDIKQVGDKYVYVAARSSGVTGEADNVWSGSVESGTKGSLSTRLSSHNEWIEAAETPQRAPLYWTAVDGTALQGVIAHPQGIEVKRLPTVVVPHGGPYYRDTLHMVLSANYVNFLALHFLVLCPNYRGSSGRGAAFAETALGGMGARDYSDTESMLAEAIKRGYVDPDKVALAGYSQGGFLTAWGVTRPNSPWKTGVIGAGPTDWGAMAITSDLPDMEADLGGSAPWSPSEPQYLRGSPIRDVKNVKVPVLITHGEKDERVPLSQAVGFMRGLVREADESVREASQLVIYPREGHGFQEKKHVEDHLERVLAHLEKYLK
ncbi:alpha/beta-hydrolase [Roridomyces roridus]|uniref:Dipeptidyl-peptidase V n=1 Tax=Roridomyces roridus TaxID=1738132 RepID=A0AAD7B1T0_9AGAR|nr:alpha/beta-hydrolase [Roridomyces roridus]